MKVRYIGKNSKGFTNGKVYEVLEAEGVFFILMNEKLERTYVLMNYFEPVKCDEVEERTGHYTTGKVEPFDVYKSMGIHSKACKANIIKYTMRQGKKEGEELKDLKKIVDYAVSLAVYSGVSPEEITKLVESRIKKELEQNEKI